LDGAVAKKSVQTVPDEPDPPAIEVARENAIELGTDNMEDARYLTKMQDQGVSFSVAP